MHFHHPSDHPVIQPHFFDAQEVHDSNGDDDSIRLGIDGATMIALKAEDLRVSDEIADLIRVSLANCSSLSDNTDVIYELLLFCETLAAGKHEDVEAIFEIIQLLSR